jgi:hypothetical protein
MSQSAMSRLVECLLEPGEIIEQEPAQQEEAAIT